MDKHPAAGLFGDVYLQVPIKGFQYLVRVFRTDDPYPVHIENIETANVGADLGATDYQRIQTSDAGPRARLAFGGSTS